MVIRLYSALVQLHLEYCGFAFGPQHNSDKDKSKQAQQQVTAMVKDLEQLVYKVMLKELHVFGLEKRRLQGGPVTVFHFEREFIEKMELDSSQSCTVKGQERMQAVIREIPITYEEKKSTVRVP